MQPPIDPQMMPAPIDAGAQMPPVDPAMMADPAMMGMPEKFYNIKFKQCIESGKLDVRVVPPEDFLIDPNATRVDEKSGNFYADLKRMTRSDAKLRWPNKKKVIDELPVYSTATDYGMEKQARDKRFWSYQETPNDTSTEEIEVIECYVNVDYDGDGVAEWRQVCIGDAPTVTSILSNEEWAGPLPYVSVTPNPMPHRYRGRSLFDDTADIQRVKTVVARQFLNNMYQVNNPQFGAVQSSVINPDALTNPQTGGVVWTTDVPANVFAPIMVPFIGDKALEALEYFDMVMEKRTGVSRSSMALDTDTLQYQTATAVNATGSASFTKVEALARNIAECGGLKELFSKILRLYAENQKSIKYVQAQGQLIPLDPKSWNADMHVTINIGLGSGSRDKDLASLGGIAQKQEMAIQALQSPFNPVLNVGHYFETLRKMVEITGTKNPERFFPAITQEQVQQISQQMQQNQPPPPEVMKIQSDEKIAQMQMTAKQQGDANRAQLDQAKSEQDAQIEKLQAEADIATVKEKTQAEIRRSDQQAQIEMQKNAAKARVDLLMKKVEVLEQFSKPPQVNEMGIPAPGPDPGAVQAVLAEIDNALAQLQVPGGGMGGGFQSQDVLGQLIKVMAAPTEIVRDQSGRAVGSRKRID